MGKKIYIGDQEIGTSGGDGGSVLNPSDYVDTSTWDAHEKVIASALVDLKSLEVQIEAFDESIQAQENALLAEVQAVEVAKADASTVYIKSDIDKSDKVVAAALADLNDRVSTLETSSGGGSGGSGSGSSFDPTDINSSISDISTRVSAIETDYVVSNDISTFVTQSVLDSSYISLESSVIALDASALAFDASIKELASAGGSGGGSSPFKYVDSKHAIINNDSYYSNSQVGNYAVVLTGFNYDYNNVQATGEYSIAGGKSPKATGAYSVALGEGQATGEYAVCISGQLASGKYSLAAVSGTARAQYSIAFGSASDAKADKSVAIGYASIANKTGSVAIGYGANSSNNYEADFGYFNKSNYGNNTFGSSTNTLCAVGNGYDYSSTVRHNAFEVRQSGDIYVADVSAAGEYYEKPMINLQQKIYELEARIAALESQLPSA